ncbi:hypothetical protein ZWY2020_024081 [Hordeum vulgare]|nr:hypothetical protein ZWY2020_024081 [Hordeum vulgare]
MIGFRGVAAFAPRRVALAHLGLGRLSVRRLLRRLPLEAPTPGYYFQNSTSNLDQMASRLEDMIYNGSSCSTLVTRARRRISSDPVHILWCPNSGKMTCRRNECDGRV